MLPLAKWMSDYYCATLIESLNSILPRPVKIIITRVRAALCPQSDGSTSRPLICQKALYMTIV